MGFHLPKGSTIICNTWAIGRDKAVFPDGETFRPERYLGEEGQKIASALNKGHTGFGFARRICRELLHFRVNNCSAAATLLTRSLAGKTQPACTSPSVPSSSS
jgi:hypothetical protein